MTDVRIRVVEVFYDLHLTDKEDPQINLGPHRSNLSESELYAAINSPGLIFVDDDRVSLVVRDIPDDTEPEGEIPNWGQKLAHVCSRR